METSDSDDERELAQPTRKKRKAAQAAEAKLQEFGKMLSGGEVGDEDAAAVESASSKRGRNGSRSAATSDHGVGESSRRRSRYDDWDENEEGSGQGEDDDYENESIMESDEEERQESNGEQEQPGKSASSSKSTAQKEKSRCSTTEYHDFAPPPFLQKILAKRQREMDNIRRQLPVDSRSREQKLADWYKMLSKLDKPVALLSLISPPQQD